MSTPTPRTSSAIIASGFQAVPEGFRAFAGILERELATLAAERDQLRAEVNEAHAATHHWCNRAERAEDNLAALEQCHDDNCRGVVKIADELAAERARLDSGQILLTVAGERVWHSGVDLRAAIDAAIKEHAK